MDHAIIHAAIADMLQRTSALHSVLAVEPL